MKPMSWLATQGSALFPFLFAVSFLYVSLALGRRVLKLCGASAGGTHAERGVICACLGAGILQFVPFALGIAGQLNVTVLRIAAMVIVICLVPDLFAVGKSARTLFRTWQRPGGWLIAWVVALSPAVLMAALIAFAPSLDPDGLGYHLTVPKRWMASGYLSFLPTYWYSGAPMGMELLFAWAMAFAGDAAAKCIHLTLGLLAVAATYLAGKRLRGPMTGAVPATLFLVGPAGAVGLLGFSYVEGGAALATASAALAWLIWYQTDTRGFLRVGALLAGIAVTFKISTALFPVALGALSLWALYVRRSETGMPHPFASSVFAMILLIPFAAAPVVPWMTRAFVVTGNPIYPLLANRIPSRDLSPALATQVDNYNRYMTWGNTFGRDWSIDQRAHLLEGVAMVLLLVGIVAFFKLRTRMERGTAVIVTLTALGQLSAAGLYLRYSLPLAAALMLPLAAPFEKWLGRRPIMLGWIAITLAFALVQARRSFLDEGANMSGLLATVAGVQDRADFLRERLPPYPLYERINRDLPANAGVMLSGYSAAFYIDRSTFAAETIQTSLRFTTWDEFTADLRRLGITHIIAPSALATGGPTPSVGGSSVSAITRGDQFRLVRTLLTEHARTLQTASDLGLYEIDSSGLR
jgi:hypothetical protein